MTLADVRPPAGAGPDEMRAWNDLKDAIAALLLGAPDSADTLSELNALIAGKQPLDSDLTAIAALATTSFGRALLTLADGAALAGLTPSGTYVQMVTGLVADDAASAVANTTRIHALRDTYPSGVELRFPDGTYHVDPLAMSVANQRWQLSRNTTLKLRNAASEMVTNQKHVVRITASGCELMGGTQDFNRAGQDLSAFNAAGGGAVKTWVGVRVEGTSGSPLTGVKVVTTVVNAMDYGLRVDYANADCRFDVSVATSGAGAGFVDCNDIEVTRVAARSLDNNGAKVYPHAVDFFRCARPTVGDLVVSDQFGTGTVAGGTSLSDYVSGITLVDVVDGTFKTLQASTRNDVTMRPGVGSSWLSVRRCTFGAVEITGYTELGLENGGVVGCQVASGVIDGRYQGGAGSPNGRGWSLYNNGYFPDFLGRAQRYTEKNQFSNIRVLRCLGEGILPAASRFNTFTNVTATACLQGVLQQYDATTAVQSFPGQSFVDIERNKWIGCDFSFNEQYGFKGVDARSARLVECSANNNGQALNYVPGNGRTRRSAVLVSDTAGFVFATSAASGSTKSGIVLVAPEAVDDQTWSETVSFDPANPSVIYPNISNRYNVGQTINLFGAGPSGAGFNFYTRINAVDLDAVTLSDPIATFATIAGTGTISSSGTAVTGSGSNFTSDLRGRFFITAGGQTRQVAAVTDGTHMTTTTAFSPALPAGTTFTIYKTPSAAVQSQKYGMELSADTLSPVIVAPTLTGNTVAPYLDSTVAGSKVRFVGAATPDTSTVVDAGEFVFPKLVLNSSGVGLSSGNLRLAYFTAQDARPVVSIKVRTGATPAGATPTLIRFGLFTVATNGDLTLVASTPNDTTLLAAGDTAYTKALSASYQKTPGQRYAFGALVVTAATAPQLVGFSFGAGSAEAADAPRIIGIVGSQADLPSSVSAGSITNSTIAANAQLIAP